jgi:hypothetical protein
VTYVAGTDYSIDREFGMLNIPAGSAIVAAAALKVSYTYTATKVTSYVAGNKPQQRFRVFGYLRNRATGKSETIEFFDVPLARTGDTNLLDGEPLKIELTGQMITPAGMTGPYRVIERAAA